MKTASKANTSFKNVKATARKAVAKAKSAAKPLVRKAKNADKSAKEAVTRNSVPVYKQTAGGVAGAIVGGVVAGPIGAVAGAIAGALMGDRAAHGKSLLPHSAASDAKGTGKSGKPKASGKPTASPVKASANGHRPPAGKKPAPKLSPKKAATKVSSK